MNQTVKQMTSFIVMDILERVEKMRAEGVSDIISMEVGEPDFDIPSSSKSAVEQALRRSNTHYTHSLGDEPLRQAICDLYRREYGVEVTSDRVMLTSGSSPAILMAMLLLCNPGDEVILSNPGYSCYANFVRAAHAVPVEVPVDAHTGFCYDVRELHSYITPRVKAIFVNSPMNPAGTLMSPEVMKEIASLGLPVISDEIYHGLVYEGKAHSMLEFTDNTYVLNGFSKRFAMTGMRLGYMIAPQASMRDLRTLQQNLMICAPSLSQKAALAALNEALKEGGDAERMRHAYDERRRFLVPALRSIGFMIESNPAGAFYVFADARRFLNDSRFPSDCYGLALDLLEHTHVAVTPGIDFGSRGEGYLRFSYATSLENIQEAVRRLKDYLS